MWFYKPPTLLSDHNDPNNCVAEEIFLPVMHLRWFFIMFAHLFITLQPVTFCTSTHTYTYRMPSHDCQMMVGWSILVLIVELQSRLTWNVSLQKLLLSHSTSSYFCVTIRSASSPRGGRFLKNTWHVLLRAGAKSRVSFHHVCVCVLLPSTPFLAKPRVRQPRPIKSVLYVYKVLACDSSSPSCRLASFPPVLVAINHLAKSKSKGSWRQPATTRVSAHWQAPRPGFKELSISAVVSRHVVNSLELSLGLIPRSELYASIFKTTR